MTQVRHKIKHLVSIHDSRTSGLDSQARETQPEEEVVHRLIVKCVHHPEEDECRAGSAGPEDGEEGDEFQGAGCGVVFSFFWFSGLFLSVVSANGVSRS